MIARFLAQVFGTANAREITRLQPIVDKINAFEPKIQALSDEQLTAKTNEFREQYMQGKSLDDILPEAFAVVRETARRKLGQRHYDVQLMGGIVLHQGKIAEMKTGEGKTLTATLALYLNAISGKGAHLVTVNDYLARRDAEWMSPVYTNLGLTVGIIQHGMSDVEKKKAYNCDIIYGTNNELGFDYLRDNMKFDLEDYVQRDLNYAIVDEVDSILIDEARTPLIISGAAEESSSLYTDADRVVRTLKKGVDYDVDEKDRLVTPTETGIDKIEAAFRINNLYAVEHMKLLHHINQALKAHALFKRDVEYVVRDGEVLIVDEFTGRILPGRRYSDGLHQAIEAKEGVHIERENQTLAAITLQNFFRLYKKLAGMTGTALTEAEEFHKIYGLSVISIPTNKPMIREDKPDMVFLTKRAKYKSIIDDIKKRHDAGQPMLIGTADIETSEYLSSILDSQNISHDVLNAKQHAREADIIATAGQPGRVTIATNMAGRGTDIKLPAESVKAGGLYILGTEKHESRRIDNQLRGRSGRQGDPGESRFYLSLEDTLITRYGGENTKKWMEFFGMKEDEPIEDAMVTSVMEMSQERVEKRNFDVRKHLLEYDDVLNQQRTVVYSYRRAILESHEQVAALLRDFIAFTVEIIVARHVPGRVVEEKQFDEIINALAELINAKPEELKKLNLSKSNVETLTSDLINALLERYELMTHSTARDEETQERIEQAQRWVVLETIDQAWKQHMLNLDFLKEGIGLRGYGQKNPLLEYKREAFNMFEDMMKGIRFEALFHLFRLNVAHFDAHALEARRQRELAEMQLDAAKDSSDEVSRPTQVISEDRTGRNETCPCGSGKKYKKCHGK
jgi:preprotein translocase subunit SecA